VDEPNVPKDATEGVRGDASTSGRDGADLDFEPKVNDSFLL